MDAVYSVGGWGVGDAHVVSVGHLAVNDGGSDYFVASLYSWDNATFKQSLLYRDRKKSIEFYLFKCSDLILSFKPKFVSI